MQDIIITGATGFIGRRLIKELLNHYPRQSILCLIKDSIKESDELEISGRKILEELNIAVKEIDLPAGRGLEELPRNPKLIIHMGASTESGDKDHSCNDIGTGNLLDAFSPISPGTKIIFTSTAAVYSGRMDTAKPIDVNTKAVTSNEYGRSKIKAEEILKDYSGKYGFNVSVLRLSTVWGEGTRKNGLFDAMKKLISERSLIPRFNWPGKTGLIHVNNVAEIISYFSLNEPSAQYQTYVVSHESLSLSDISKLLHQKLKLDYEPVSLPDVFWKSADAFIKRTYLLENILPAGFYNTFWRLNLIINDSLCCKPDEILELVPGLNIEMKKFE